MLKLMTMSWHGSTFHMTGPLWAPVIWSSDVILLSAWTSYWANSRVASVSGHHYAHMTPLQYWHGLSHYKSNSCHVIHINMANFCPKYSQEPFHSLPSRVRYLIYLPVQSMTCMLILFYLCNCRIGLMRQAPWHGILVMVTHLKLWWRSYELMWPRKNDRVPDKSLQ